MSKLDKLTLFIHHPGPDDRNRHLMVIIDEKRVWVRDVQSAEGLPPEVDRPVYGYEWSIARDLMLELAAAADGLGKLKDVLNQMENNRAQDQHRLFHVEGIVEEQWKEGEQAVLDFIQNGRFLSDSAPTAQFAREVAAGWKAWGKAEADKARRRKIDEAVEQAINQT